ncbi:MAG: cytochrome c3 family protein [Acidobacteriota bacterium]|jgi:predicted CXXCH cytochrome family protein
MRRPSVLLLAGLVLPPLLAGPAYGQGTNPYHLKPGARGPICLSCHSDLEEQLQQRSVHTPVKAGECSDCHSPHASSHGQLLSDDPARICAGCHDDLLPAEPVSVHPAIAEAGCVGCHDPHASPNANNLLYPGNELCYACHADKQAEVEGEEFQHAPAVDDCLACHDPHASGETVALLRQDVGDLCAGCHDVSQASFVQRHGGYPVAGSDCTSCHDPHGSNRSGILLARLHEPVANRLCSQCHEDPGSADPLQRRSPGVSLCAGCHSEVINEVYARPELHWPVMEGAACANCHAPHGADEAALLVAPPETLCGGCHGDVLEAVAGSMEAHPPVATGECTACHEPHAADHPFLVQAADDLQLCGSCHDWETHSSHPIGPDVADPRNPNLTLGCSSCHRPHGSPFKALAHLDLGGDMCVQCHQQMQR